MCRKFFAEIELNKLSTELPIDIVNQFEAEELFPFMNYNIGYKGECLIFDSKGLQNLTFGLMYKRKIQINARIETYFRRGGYYQGLRRFILIVNGYYIDEYQNPPYVVERQQYYMYIAALRNEESFIILTQDSKEDIFKYHHRMPMFLSQYDIPGWLQKDINQQKDSTIYSDNFLKQLLQEFSIYQVSNRSIYMKNKDKTCIIPKKQYKQYFGKKKQITAVDIFCWDLEKIFDKYENKKQLIYFLNKLQIKEIKIKIYQTKFNNQICSKAKGKLI